MNNRGADYIKRLLKDKERFKKWKRIMLALSCVVVFITVYALTIPAVTLACDKEEHVHTTECYNENNELICTKEEHTHSEDCYEKEEQEQDPVEEEDEDVAQDETQVVSNEEVTKPEEEQNTTEGEGKTTTKDPFVLNDSPRLESVKVSNNKNDEGIPSGTLTPDSKYLKITVHFKDMIASELRDNYGCSFTYTLPEFFRMTDTTPRDITDSNNNVIGNIHVEKGKAIVTYNEDFLNSDVNATLKGSFFVEGAIDLSKLYKNNGTITFTKPDGNITLDYGLDYLEKFGDVKVEKQCSKDDKNSDYVKYTIKVTAGQDGSKNVYVVDKFTNNSQLVTYAGDISNVPKELEASLNGQNPYEGRSKNVAGKVYLTNMPTSDNEVPEQVTGGSSITTPGSLVWSIDTLAPNETRTLTYFVKLKDTEGAINKNNNQTITNEANAFTKSSDSVYMKDTSSSEFKPYMEFGMNKEIVQTNNKNYTKDQDGNYIVQYKLNFTLKDSSNYPLKKFVFWDYLDYNDNIRTDEKMLPYISYNRESVEVYGKKAGEKDYSKLNSNQYVLKWGNKTIEYTDKWTDKSEPTHFNVMVTGTEDNPITMNHGDSYYVTYKLKVKPEVYAAMQSNKVEIKNRYLASSQNASDGTSSGIIDKVYQQLNLEEYSWVQKSLDNDVTDKDQTINMGSSDIYVKKNGNYEKDASVKSFEVPAGSYKYTVNVNQTMNQFNVTDATLKDELSSGIMHYVGYVKITPYKYNAETNNYEDQKPKWVKIDNQQEFELKLSQIGWSNKNEYRFEYYAKTDDLSQVANVAVTNKFTINGDVVGDDGTFKFNDVSSSQTIQVKGYYSLSVNKSAWYYEKPQENVTSWINGKLYWVIKVDGSAIRKDTEIKDVISSDKNLTDSFLHKDSVACIYLDKTAQDINSYASYEEFLNSNKGLVNKSDSFEQKFTNDKKFSGTDNNSELTLTAKETLTLNNGESVYIVIRTEPQRLPEAYRETCTYKNHAYKKNLGDADFTECNNASQALYGGPNILKELGQTFTYDGKTVSTIKAGADLTNSKDPDPNKICKELLDKSTSKGAYISWAFKVNYAGDLKGTYQVLEDIPNGMELSYIRIKWHGDNAQNVQSQTIDGLSGWEQRIETTTNDNGNTNQITTYYYNKTKNQALIKLGEFEARKERDTYSVDVQVVCRVTDEKVLLGGEGKSFTNKVTLLSKDGQTEIDTATNTATTQNNCLDKSHVQKGQKIDYTITANILGQKLPLNDGDKLTLVDELSKNLELDTSTIKAVDESGKDVPIDKSFNPDTRVLEISIPNNEKVIITYTVTVKEAPETEATVSNKVYWKSYSDNGGKNDVIEKFTYSLNAGGSTDSTGNPQLTIKKVDQDNSNLMNGVTFDVYECELNGNTIQRVTSNNKTSGTTVNGIYSIDQSFITKYNTIYEIKETNTPKGYIEDKNSYYIIYLKKENGNYSDYANSCKKYFEKQNNKYYKIAYTPADFNPVIYNTQKGIVVKKAFINNAAGNVTKPVSGTYTFGLYEDAQGNGERIQTQTIKYSAGEAQEKTAKFINLELDKTYYVFELDDKGNPIVNSSQEVTINKLQYTVEYKNEKDESTNAATNGQTVTVTNRSRTKILPSTGGYGSLLYRISGAMLALASLIYLTNIYKKNHLDDTSKKRRKK